MADYTITLTDTEQKAMEHIAADVDEWITNAAQNRARIAIDEIVAKLVKHCNENDIALAVGKDAQVTQAYDLNIVAAASSESEPRE
jgi:2-hydroxy-3-keto-5-methylthiopentenyl-1-phosphate phosphatase|tara:strand:+ start:3212 stop:3469 length:258 start_codon:yes stop_codon:yes gene_type:complete